VSENLIGLSLITIIKIKMKRLFGSIWRYIVDIFVEDISDMSPKDLLEIRDLTRYYLSDFPKIQLDQVLV
jgi:hypothetical protein